MLNLDKRLKELGLPNFDEKHQVTEEAQAAHGGNYERDKSFWEGGVSEMIERYDAQRDIVMKLLYTIRSLGNSGHASESLFVSMTHRQAITDASEAFGGAKVLDDYELRTRTKGLTKLAL